MSGITRTPTEIAPCGCPYDPEYDEGHLGWHLVENHLSEEFAEARHDLEDAAARLAALEHALRLRGVIHDRPEAA